jgi:hypothetical protein
MPSTAAQDEFNALFHRTGRSSPSQPHPEDLHSEGEHSSHEPSSSSNPGRALRDTARQGDSSDSDIPDSSSNMRSRYFIPTNTSRANTGPKGVIADAQAFRQAKQMHMSSLKLGNGSVVSHEQPAEHPSNTTWLLDEDRETDEEDEFLDSWRQSRLRELSRVQGRVTQASSRNARTRVPARYGSMQTVDAVGYLDAVEQTPSDHVVLVFIYDGEASLHYLIKKLVLMKLQSEVSEITEQCVWDLAKAYPSVRVVKLHYKEAQMEPAGVPAILAYRAGEKFAGLIPVLDEIPEEEELSTETLAAALRR